jgi:Tfp pilus assembly protein PilF
MNPARNVAALAIFFAISGCALKEYIVWLHDPLEAGEHLKLGVAYEKEGRLDLAEEQYLLALRKDRKQAKAWAALGNIHLAKDRPGKAIKSYGRALNLEPDSADVLNNLAAAFLGQGKLEEAEQAVERAISLNGPNLYYYMDTRGQVRLQKGERRGAVQDFCRALEMPFDDDEFRKEVSQRLMRLGGTCK